MYQVRKTTGEVVASFDTLKEAQLFILSNWNVGPMIVTEALTENTVAKPTLLSE